MDFTLWTKLPPALTKYLSQQKITTLMSLDLAACEPQHNFLFCFQDHFSPLRIGPPSWKTFTVILVDRTARSTNFKQMSLIHVNSRTHNTPYVSNIETTKTLSDLQFCRYNQTPLKVASTKYEVAMLILLFLCQKMYACIKMFLRPPLTQRYFFQFCRNFNKLWIIRTMLDTDKWNTN